MATDTVFVVDHGWHTDLGIPAAALRGPLTSFRRMFPGLAILMVGFGRRTFMTAPADGIEDYLIGPFPGRGALLVAGLSAAPDRAYVDGTVARLRLPPGGADRLSAFVWSSFRLEDGRPVAIAPGFFPGSRFYAASLGYSGLYTCNSWTEDALYRAGLLPPADGVLFAGQVMDEAGPGSCRIARP